MRKPCQRCRGHDDHYYWDHMKDEEKHFFKVMVGDFRHRMKIPEEFTKKFSGHISEVIELEAPNGKKCSVQVTRGLNKLVLESGWETFCTAHGLQQGDFLVFRYSGSSHFMVLIFHSNGCQKVSSCIVRNSGPTVQEESDSSVKMPSCSLPPFRRFGSAQRYQHRRLKRKTEIVISTNSSSHNSDVPSLEEIQDPVNSADRRKSNEYRYVLSRNSHLTREQESEVAALEQRIKPAIPLYVTVVKAKNKNSLIIRAEYAIKYLPREDGTITLFGPSGSEYGDVDFKIRRDGKNVLTGWLSFMRSTGLKEGDVCIFEISKTQTRVTITVHFLPRKYPPFTRPKCSK